MSKSSIDVYESFEDLKSINHEDRETTPLKSPPGISLDIVRVEPVFIEDEGWGFKTFPCRIYPYQTTTLWTWPTKEIAVQEAEKQMVILQEKLDNLIKRQALKSDL